MAAAGILATDLAGGKATSAATARVAGIIHSTGGDVIALGGRPARADARMNWATATIRAP